MIRVLKAIGWGLAHAYGRVLARLVGIRGFAHARVWAGQIRGPVGEMVRQAFYRRTLRSVGTDCRFFYGCNFSCPDIRVGDHARVGYGTHVGQVDIGADTLIGAYCSLISGNRIHGIGRTDIPIRLQPGEQRRVTIGRDCMIGVHAIVLADLGEGAVVGAGAVVTRPIPPWSVAVGNPARVIRSRQNVMKDAGVPEHGAPGDDLP